MASLISTTPDLKSYFSTYVQDEYVPIYIILQYDNAKILKFPINPESLKMEIPSASETVDIEGIGQVSVPKTPELAKITISSFFWSEVNYIPSSVYVLWLEQWQKSKKPANLIITRLNYSMKVTCESFSHWINAGEEKDVYFDLELKEYRPYGAKKLNVVKNNNFLERVKGLKDLPLVPTLIEIPRDSRSSINKSEITNPYTVSNNETVLTITKKITGTTDDWESLYNNNISVLGEVYNEGNEIPCGTSLILPDKWINNSTYNIKTVDNLGV